MTDKRSSEIWNYFEIIDNENKLAICNLCNQSLSYKSTIHNLKTHFVRKHPRAYRLITNEENSGTRKDPGSDSELIEEYLETSDANAADSDHVSNSSGDDSPKRSSKSYKSIESKTGEKWFVQFNSKPETKPTARRFTGGVKKVGKKRSEVLRQLEIMAQDREKTTNIQMEVYNLQKEKEKLILQQNTKEHELRYSILQLEYENKKEQLAMLRKENGKE